MTLTPSTNPVLSNWQKKLQLGISNGIPYVPIAKGDGSFVSKPLVSQNLGDFLRSIPTEAKAEDMFRGEIEPDYFGSYQFFSGPRCLRMSAIFNQARWKQNVFWNPQTLKTTRQEAILQMPIPVTIAQLRRHLAPKRALEILQYITMKLAAEYQASQDPQNNSSNWFEQFAQSESAFQNAPLPYDLLTDLFSVLEKQERLYFYKNYIMQMGAQFFGWRLAEPIAGIRDEILFHAAFDALGWSNSDYPFYEIDPTKDHFCQLTQLEQHGVFIDPNCQSMAFQILPLAPKIEFKFVQNTDEERQIKTIPTGLALLVLKELGFQEDNPGLPNFINWQNIHASVRVKPQ
ncbi:MAG: hypothetical protein H7A33_00935 [Deltaproteobacteria bacterium]|nr:hypothetical protein [Deltaproteobacteria bacterium]